MLTLTVRGTTIRLGTARTGAQGPPGEGGASTAADVAFTPTDDVESTDVQAAIATLGAGFAALSTALATDYVRTTRQVIAGTGLTGGGALDANRTFAVSFGSSAGTVCAGDDSRLGDARTPTLHGSSHAPGASDAIPPAAPITESGTARTLTSADHGRTILCTHASGCEITIPHDLSPGHETFVRRRGGAVTFAGSGGLTATPPDGFTAELHGAGSGASIYVESATVAALDGDLAVA